MSSGRFMTEGEKRRMKILELLKNGKSLPPGSGGSFASGSGEAPAPVSGGSLAAMLGVSRQVIVQDIALLRADNKGIMSTYKGYILHNPGMEAGACIRVFYVNHSTADTLDEFQSIVDLGGRVLDVSVEHELYGHITVDLIINNRLDAAGFVEQMKASHDRPLKALTGDCHYHTVAADQERNLDLIEEALMKKGYLIHD